jgi:hypothetical protein
VFSSKEKKDIFFLSIFISPIASPLNIGLPATKQVTRDLVGAVGFILGDSGLLWLITANTVSAIAATPNQNIALSNKYFIGTHSRPVFAVS